MKPHVARFAAIVAETKSGTFIVNTEDLSASELRACEWFARLSRKITDDDRHAATEALKPYLAGCGGVDDLEIKFGYYSRLSADGYIDCTEWSGPFKTEEQAIEHLCDLHDIYPNGVERDGHEHTVEWESVTEPDDVSTGQVMFRGHCTGCEQPVACRLSKDLFAWEVDEEE
jgi:hypothetical protein